MSRQPDAATLAFVDEAGSEPPAATRGRETPLSDVIIEAQPDAATGSLIDSSVRLKEHETSSEVSEAQPGVETALIDSSTRLGQPATSSDVSEALPPREKEGRRPDDEEELDLHFQLDGAPHRHFMLYKPEGYMTQFVYNGETPPAQGLKLLGELFTVKPPLALMAVGRLDVDSEGLLLLTTDGRLAHFLTKSRQVDKEYHAQVQGAEVTPESLATLRDGGLELSTKKGKYLTRACGCVLLDDVKLPPPTRPNPQLLRKKQDGTVLVTPTSWLGITLREGKNRQIRRMTAAVGHPTLRLVRVRVGEFKLGGLQPGEVKDWQPGDELIQAAHAYCIERNRLRLLEGGGDTTTTTTEHHAPPPPPPPPGPPLATL